MPSRAGPEHLSVIFPALILLSLAFPFMRPSTCWKVPVILSIASGGHCQWSLADERANHLQATPALPCLQEALPAKAPPLLFGALCAD